MLAAEFPSRISIVVVFPPRQPKQPKTLPALDAQAETAHGFDFAVVGFA